MGGVGVTTPACVGGVWGVGTWEFHVSDTTIPLVDETDNWCDYDNDGSVFTCRERAHRRFINNTGADWWVETHCSSKDRRRK